MSGWFFEGGEDDGACEGCTCCSAEECLTYAEDPCDRERCACWAG